MTNKIDYFEIGSPDPDVSKAFYGALFDWEIEDPTGPAPYRMVDEARGGLWDTSDMGAANWAIFYVRVEDVHSPTTAVGLEPARGTAPDGVHPVHFRPAPLAQHFVGIASGRNLGG